MTEITVTEGVSLVPGWVRVNGYYGALHVWRKEGTRTAVFCLAEPDSFERARALLAGQAVGARRIGRDVEIYDSAALAMYFGLDLILPPAG